MKNVEEWHNFGLIMVFFFWFERTFYGVLYLGFGGVKGHFLKCLNEKNGPK